MNDTDSLRVACPECGKRLRVKAALDGKRLKCPACSVSFQVNAQPNEDDGDEQPEGKAFPWLLVGVASGAVVLLALVLFLWLGARSEAAGLRAQLTESGDKAAKTTDAIEHLRKQLEVATKNLGTATTDIEDLKKKLKAEKEVTTKQAAVIDDLKTKVAAAAPSQPDKEKTPHDAKSPTKAEEEKKGIQDKIVGVWNATNKSGHVISFDKEWHVSLSGINVGGGQMLVSPTNEKGLVLYAIEPDGYMEKDSMKRFPTITEYQLKDGKKENGRIWVLFAVSGDQMELGFEDFGMMKKSPYTRTDTKPAPLKK